MRWLRGLVTGASLVMVACSTIDRSALDDPGPRDAAANTGADTASTGGDGGGAADLGGAMGGDDVVTPVTPTDAGVSGAVDAGTSGATDAGGPIATPSDSGTTPVVDAGSPAPVDSGSPADTGCRACMAFAPVAFCPGSGMGYCLAYQGCTSDGCAVCAPPMMGGDDCGSPLMLSATGRQRTVVTTCGARNNINTSCNGTGPDIVLGVRVARRGRVVVRTTVPAGVTVNFGYDLLGSGSCANERIGRRCAGGSLAVTQSIDLTLDAGTYYLYVGTSQATTVVVETELP